MDWFYSLIDCFIIPSHWEPMGMTEIESMAMNKFVIASDVEGLNEIVKNNINGLLFTPKNINDLHNKLNIFLTNETTKNNILSNLNETVNNYSIDKFFSTILFHYKSITT